MAHEITANPKNEKTYTYITRSGETMKLNKSLVMKFIAGDQKITDQEFIQFVQLCKLYKVNPFVKEAYLIKYGNQPATIVVDYKVLQQIAEANPHYRGMKHGVLVVKKDGSVEERRGEYLLPNETLIAGWCEVIRDDKTEPFRVVASFEEFKGVKKDGTMNGNWVSKPCFMIAKVAKAQCLREAFPNDLGSNVYSTEEVDTFDGEANDIASENARKASHSPEAVKVEDTLDEEATEVKASPIPPIDTLDSELPPLDEDEDE